MNKFSKMITILAITLAVFFTGNSFACDPGDVNCGNYSGVGVGAYNIGANTLGGGFDYDYTTINNGISGGLSGANGSSKGDAKGVVVNGTVGGNIDLVGGGITNTSAYDYNVTGGKGVGSSSQSEGVTGGSLDVNVDPKGTFTVGATDGKMSGKTDESTLNGSVITTKNNYDSDGMSAGLANQSADGSFKGDVEAAAMFKNGDASAHVDADIDLIGNSYSESYRYKVDGDGYKVEGLGTNVEADTTAITSGSSYDAHHGFADADADICGGYNANGGVVAGTVQTIDGDVASANAVGIYTGAGVLNTNYNGSAIGGTSTSITTVDGMNGSIVRSGSGMQVNSIVTHNTPS